MPPPDSRRIRHDPIMSEPARPSFAWYFACGAVIVLLAGDILFTLLAWSGGSDGPPGDPDNADSAAAAGLGIFVFFVLVSILAVLLAWSRITTDMAQCDEQGLSGGAQRASDR